MYVKNNNFHFKMIQINNLLTKINNHDNDIPQISQYANQLYSAIQDIDYKKIFKILCCLNKQQIFKLSQTFQFYTGYILIDYMQTKQFGFLTKQNTPEVYSIEYVYEKACQIEQIENSQSFYLVQPVQLVGELIRSIIQTSADYATYSIIQSKNLPIQLLEIIMSKNEKQLVDIQRSFTQHTKQTIQQYLANNHYKNKQFIQIISAKLATSQTQRIVEEFDCQKDVEIIAASCKGYKFQLNTFLYYFLVVDISRIRQILARFGELNNCSLETQIKQKFGKQPLVEYGLQLLIDYSISQFRLSARILRKAIKDNRDSAIIRIIGENRDQLQQLNQAYSDMFQSSLKKDILKSSYGIYKDVLQILFNAQDDHK